MPSTFSTAEEERVYAKVSRRLLPYLFLFYVIDHLDRVNIGFAKLQMMADLHWSDTIYGLGAGTFFIGYFLFEVPGNLILYKWGAREWMATIMVVWGLISASMMFVHSPFWFYLLRFALGLAEAGFFPGIILYLTYWYPYHRRGRATAIFMTALAVTGLVGGPLSGWIMEAFHGVGGLTGWQWLFVLEGLPAVAMGGLTLFILDDSIRAAKWLTEEEKRLLEKNIANETHSSKHSGLGSMLRDGRIWLLSLILFLLIMGFYGISFWMPQLIHNTGVHDVLNVGLLCAIPYGVATIAMVLVGRSSDRMGERYLHLAVCSFLGALGLVVSALFDDNTWISMSALTVATAGIFATIPLCVALPTEFLNGIAAAAGIALVNSFGNLGGFVSPRMVGALNDATHQTAPGVYALAGCLFLAGIILVISRPRPKALPVPYDSIPVGESL